MKNQQIRQGDVQLQPVAKLPPGCTELPPQGDRIVLAHGEVTGHAHAIYDYQAAASEITDAAIARAKARLWQAPSGDRYLEVSEPVTLKHEEHTSHTLLPGIYKLPQQVEYVAHELVRQVQD